MRISSTSFSTNFLSEINQLQQRQNTLQQEASTGLSVTQPEDNPEVMTNVLNLQTQSSASTQYQANVSKLQTTANLSYTAMSNLKTISDRVDEIATLATSGTASPDQLNAYAQEVNNLVQEAAQLGNSQDANGNYLFGGTASTQPPYTVTQNSSNVVTSVTANGNSSVAKAEIAPGVTISAEVPGSNTTGSGTPGLFQDSASGVDIFAHMISLQQDLASGNTAAITANDAPALTKDNDNIVSQISANGVLQSTLSNATNIASAQSLNITTEVSNATTADLATVITQLDQTQTAYQAALESGSKILSLSLLDYLH
ncbi:MAG TPA: flagellar hook-associated protein FlgL [Verrucomicrobiae bacterium]|jgi:flagellar hook-associated protein 3 FlgL|nr:flagellar hook-associated protein FlgL [Verrucomicrobiae bacterium]